MGGQLLTTRLVSAIRDTYESGVSLKRVTIRAPTLRVARSTEQMAITNKSGGVGGGQNGGKAYRNEDEGRRGKCGKQKRNGNKNMKWLGYKQKGTTETDGD